MGNIWSQFRQAYPPPPGFTEKDVPDLSGKVAIVTGANTGVGKDLARIFYSRNATVYLGARTEAKAQATAEAIKTQHPSSTGRLEFLILDLGDLATVKRAADEFLEAGSRLDLLVNNAGMMTKQGGELTKQGHDMTLGTNTIAPFLLARLLAPRMAETVQLEDVKEGETRVVWVSSSAADHSSPWGGVVMDELREEGQPRLAGAWGWWLRRYAISKAGNYYHGTEFARRWMKEGIVSVSLNPGNLRSDLYRTMQDPMTRFGKRFFLHDPVYGAYTELFAALSSDITLAMSGCWVVPWGRLENIRGDLVAGSKTKEEGGTGIAKEFWEWSEEQVAEFS